MEPATDYRPPRVLGWVASALLAGHCLGAGLQTPVPADPVAGGMLYQSVGQVPYFHGKYGFKSIREAKDHTFKEFKQLVQAGRIDPAKGEYFSYIYTLQPGHGPRRTFHSEWTSASYLKTESGGEQYAIVSPIAESATIRKTTLIHSHPTGNPNGEGPSRMDVALASTYKKADGSYRYLYLINNHGRLLRYKARRTIAPGDRGAVALLPLRPCKGKDWLD